MTKTVPDFGQAQITCGGVKLAFQGPNHPPTCLVKDENNRTSKTTIKNQFILHTIHRQTPKRLDKQQKQIRGNHSTESAKGKSG